MATEDPMFSSRTVPELLRAIQGMMTEARHLGAPVTTEVQTGSREITYEHHVLAREAMRIYGIIERFRAGLDAGDDPKTARGSPGLRRLRDDPRADTIRQAVLSDNEGARREAAERMKEKKSMSDVATTNGTAPPAKKKAPAAKKKKAAAKKAAPKKAKAAKKAGAERAARMTFADDAVITIKLKDNPRRKGSAAYDRLETLIKSGGKAVKAFRAKGGRDATLSNAVKKGWASVK